MLVVRISQILIIWDISLARNKAIFKDVFIPPKIYATKNLAILSHFSQDDGPPKVRRNEEKVIDISGCWCYFDVASQGDQSMGGM